MPFPAIYLASRSPRRQALLTQIGVPFEVLSLPPTAVIENPAPHETPTAYVRRMARAKAIVGMRQARLRGYPPRPVLGADTEVVLNGRVFGKPRGRDDAAAMLRTLSGETHEVLSAVTLCLPPQRGKRLRMLDALATTLVTFKRLSAGEIAAYLDSGEPFGKAGAYAIQGRAGAFVVRLVGSYPAVVGLPLYETAQLLAAAGDDTAKQ